MHGCLKRTPIVAKSTCEVKRPVIQKPMLYVHRPSRFPNCFPSDVEARDHFTSLIRKVEQGTAVELTRHGKPVAVLISMAEYQKLNGERPSFWDALTLFRNNVDLRQMDIQPEIFENLRDSSPGREVAF